MVQTLIEHAEEIQCDATLDSLAQIPDGDRLAELHFFEPREGIMRRLLERNYPCEDDDSEAGFFRRVRTLEKRESLNGFLFVAGCCFVAPPVAFYSMYPLVEVGSKAPPGSDIGAGAIGCAATCLVGLIAGMLAPLAVAYLPCTIMDVLSLPAEIARSIYERNDKKRCDESSGFRRDVACSSQYAQVVRLPNREIRNKNAFKDTVFQIARYHKMGDRGYATNIIFDARDCREPDYDFLGLDQDPSKTHKLGLRHSDFEREQAPHREIKRKANSGLAIVNTEPDRCDGRASDARLLAAISNTAYFRQ